MNLKKRLLCEALGHAYTEAEFEKLCFDFGIELDEVMEEAGDDGTTETVWKVEIAANRYDLLCLEGLARALRVFLGKEPTPVSAWVVQWCGVGPHFGAGDSILGVNASLRESHAVRRGFDACFDEVWS